MRPRAAKRLGNVRTADMMLTASSPQNDGIHEPANDTSVANTPMIIAVARMPRMRVRLTRVGGSAPASERATSAVATGLGLFPSNRYGTKTTVARGCERCEKSDHGRLSD